MKNMNEVDIQVNDVLLVTLKNGSVLYGTIDKVSPENFLIDDNISGDIMVIDNFEIESVLRINKWIPVKYGIFPEENEDVQVTYLGYYDCVPRCNEFAYWCGGKWYWTHCDEECRVEITAWRKSEDPYIDDESGKM